MTYQECDQLLQGRCKNRRKIANNTYLNRLDERELDGGNDTFYITLHGHNIVEFLEDGTIIYDTCGWKTNTTKDRMNRFGGASITQKNYIWYDHGVEVHKTWKNTDLLSVEERNLRMEMA